MHSTTTRGKKRPPHPDPADPPRRRAKKRKGRGTYANEPPPLISLISRATGGQRLWVWDHADQHTCSALLAENLPGDSAALSTDEWQGYRGSHPAHATVCHGVHAWARDDAGDRQREVHCNSCEGAGAALRTYLRAFRGVHKPYLHLDVATYEAMIHAKRITPELIQRMGSSDPLVHTGYT
jgi:transposase